MAWQDRLKEAAYVSPGGTRLVFAYENVSRAIDKKTAAFDFPDANGTYVQDLGHSGRRYPLQVIFWGEDYDQRADAFEALLLEVGVGKLEHPLYGTIDVVPFGAITRRDDLKTAANQAIIDVTFFETIGVVYPTSQDDPGAAVLAAVEAFSDAGAQQLNDTLKIDKAVERAGFKAVMASLLNLADAAFGSLDHDFTSIENAVKDFVSGPRDLAAQAIAVVKAPARAAATITDRLNAYKSLIADAIAKVLRPGYDNLPANEFHTRDLFASAYVTGAIVAVANTQFETKTDALTAAEDILGLFDDVAAWQDSNYASLGEVDTGTAYEALQEAVALTAGFLVFISFSLKQERRLVLDRNRTIVDLTAQLYNSVDDQLDFFIASNNLTGSEILELPAGREVVYYV